MKDTDLICDLLQSFNLIEPFLGEISFHLYLFNFLVSVRRPQFFMPGIIHYFLQLLLNGSWSRWQNPLRRLILDFLLQSRYLFIVIVR